MCGLRQGEALALRWQDVDLEAGTLRVNRQLQRVRGGLAFSEPKNASRRTVGLSRKAVSAFKSLHTRQLEEKLGAQGPSYADGEAPRGHASIQLTLDRYSHWMPSMGKHTASAIDEALEDRDKALEDDGEALEE